MKLLEKKAVSYLRGVRCSVVLPNVINSHYQLKIITFNQFWFNFRNANQLEQISQFYTENSSNSID